MSSFRIALTLGLILTLGVFQTNTTKAQSRVESYDIVVLGGTPGGIMAAVAASREGRSVLLLERTGHIGGLPANGLGATDIFTRGATRGLFFEFISRNHAYYVETYGSDSPQARDSSSGYFFEPSVAERVFHDILAEHSDRIEVRLMRQFDCDPTHVTVRNGRLSEILVFKREDGGIERYAGEVFIDATYEGDLAAAAGALYSIGREDARDYGEPMAGKIYKEWGGPVGEGSTGLGDNAVQAYNYRLCLTTDKDNWVPIPKPENYNRDEFVSLIDDVKLDRRTGEHRGEMAYDGIGRVVNMVRLPNGKTDANNQHLAFISTDLPEENWPWPTAGWDWRDAYAERLRDYTLGLLWFAQNDPELPEDFRERCREWGLAKDEYVDNDNFPRQVYVREGRRIEGEHFFTAHDALPVRDGARPPIYSDSVTASHYALDSHAVLKREPGRVHLDGFFSFGTQPYTVPYGVIVPVGVDALLTPVPVSGTHIGFSTLRMEPCWMALGEAAGIAASLAIEEGVDVREISIDGLQQKLLDHGAVLIHFRDAAPGDEHYSALQFFALRDFYPMDAWEAQLNEPISDEWASKWIEWSVGQAPSGFTLGRTTRGELLSMLREAVFQLPKEQRESIQGQWTDGFEE